MSTNDEPEVTDSQETAVSTDAEADLRQAKAEAETKSQTEESEQVAQSTEPAEADSEQSLDATLTTEVPPESDKDLDWYKKAYAESTKEALRLKGELDKSVTPPPVTPPAADATDQVLTPEQLYVKTQLVKESDEAFKTIVETYPQVKDAATYQQFVKTSEVLSKTIIATEQRFPSASELYNKTAIVMGLQPDTTEQVGAAVKDAASSSVRSGVAAPPVKSKVTEEVIAFNMKLYPDKTRQEIIEELEPHIQ